jgi:hypothetical protein
MKKNFIGKKFGKLTVLHLNEQLSVNKKFYDCLCECGNYKTVSQDSLNKGNSKSCGCAKGELNFFSRHNGIDPHLNIKFNHLTCIERVDEFAKKYDDGKKRNTKYKFICDCGQQKICPLSDVKSGRIKSCGCARKYGSPFYSNTQFKSLEGEKFFHLTVIKRMENKHKKIYYLCRCDCGNELVVRGESLKTFHNKSCGCKKTSVGELMISIFLEQNNIEYKKQYFFNDLPLLKFDFALQSNSGKILLIEFDGRQHFEPVKKFGGDIEFSLQKKRDNRKNYYCQEKNIPLLRIHYKQIKQIEKLITEFLALKG